MSDGHANLTAAQIRARLSENPPLRGRLRENMLAAFFAWRERLQELALMPTPPDLKGRHELAMASAEAIKAALQVLREGNDVQLLEPGEYHDLRDSLYQLDSLQVPIRTYDPPTAPPVDTIDPDDAGDRTYDSGGGFDLLGGYAEGGEAPEPSRTPSTGGVIAYTSVALVDEAHPPWDDDSPTELTPPGFTPRRPHRPGLDSPAWSQPDVARTAPSARAARPPSAPAPSIHDEVTVPRAAPVRDKPSSPPTGMGGLFRWPPRRGGRGRD